MRCIAVHTLKVKGKRVLPGASVTLAAEAAQELIGIGHVVEANAETLESSVPHAPPAPPAPSATPGGDLAQAAQLADSSTQEQP